MVTNMQITMPALFQKLVNYVQLEAEYWTAVNCWTTMRHIYDRRITHRPSIGCSTEQSLTRAGQVSACRCCGNGTCDLPVTGRPHTEQLHVCSSSA